VDITLTRSNAPRKHDRFVIYKINDRPGSVQFLKTLFENDAVPTTLTLTGTFAAPKIKETPEQRKARIKSLPKPTPAERLAKLEQRIARLKVEAEKDASPKDTPATTASARRPARK